MQFKIDENLHADAAELLRQHGHDKYRSKINSTFLSATSAMYSIFLAERCINDFVRGLTMTVHEQGLQGGADADIANVCRQEG